MAEALAALGIAANIFQFVECGCRIVVAAHKLKSSKDAAVPSIGESKLLAEDLSTTMAKLRASSAVPVTPELSTLMSACVDLSDDLLRTLGSFDLIPGQDNFLTRLRASFRLYRKADEIRNLETRLTKLRTQICDHLNLQLLSELVAQEVSENTFRQLAAERLETLSSQVTKLLEGRNWDKAQTFSNPSRDETFTELAGKINLLQESVLKERRINRVLKSLHFRQIKERISEVHNAHAKTFEWVFGSQPKTNLVEWMSSSQTSSVYWVSGHAGSGKSTLMKFLLDHPLSIQALQQWAGSQPLAVASHFFWSAGTPIQKSQEGLIRTILFQILLQEVELIPLLCPERWGEGIAGHLEPWTLDELCKKLHELANLPEMHSNICIFVDGLDEYRGDHRELLSLLFKISEAPRFKICMSSRPWIEFRQAFRDTQWKFAVQDLTAEDIQNYARDKLCSAQPAYPWLETYDLVNASKLAEEICNKAQGVFLWVFLVVRSLQRGLANDDSFQDLQNRLNELPSDLEAYFKLMLDDIDSIYRTRTAKVFKCLIHAESSMPVLLFHFFQLEEEDSQYAVSSAVAPMRESQILAIVRPKKNQLVAQCKDLIKFSCHQHEPASLRDRVTFLHRTVSDFFRTESMDALMSARAGLDYEPRLALCKAFLAMIRSIPASWIPDRLIPLDRIRRFALGIIAYGIEVEVLGRGPEIYPVLQNLNLALKEFLGPFKADKNDYWDECFPKTDCHSGLELMMRIGPLEYLNQAVLDLEPEERIALDSQARKPKIIVSFEEGFTFYLSTYEGLDGSKTLD